jgi:hypothetical protein
VDKKSKDTFSCIFAFTKNIPIGKMCPKRDNSGIFFAAPPGPEKFAACRVLERESFPGGENFPLEGRKGVSFPCLSVATLTLAVFCFFKRLV